jgi:hypothetical protein
LWLRRRFDLGAAGINFGNSLYVPEVLRQNSKSPQHAIGSHVQPWVGATMKNSFGENHRGILCVQEKRRRGEPVTHHIRVGR